MANGVFGQCTYILRPTTYLCVVLLAVDGVLGPLAALLPPVRVELPQFVLALERPSAQACAQSEVILALLWYAKSRSLTRAGSVDVDLEAGAGVLYVDVVAGHVAPFQRLFGGEVSRVKMLISESLCRLSLLLHLGSELLVEDGAGSLDVDGGLPLALRHRELLVPVGGSCC